MLGEAEKVTPPVGEALDENESTWALQVTAVLVDATLKTSDGPTVEQVRPMKLEAGFIVTETVELVDPVLPLVSLP